MVVAEAVTMSGFLDSIQTFLTEALSWLSEVLGTITGSPVLTVLCLAMPLVGFAVGLLRRLIRL